METIQIKLNYKKACELHGYLQSAREDLDYGLDNAEKLDAIFSDYINALEKALMEIKQ